MTSMTPEKEFTVRQAQRRSTAGNRGQTARRGWRGWRTVALVALVGVTMGTMGSQAQSRGPGPLPAPAGAHVEAALAARLSHGKDTDLLRVIVTMKPGTKAAMVSALRAQGGRVTHDFGLAPPSL